MKAKQLLATVGLILAVSTTFAADAPPPAAALNRPALQSAKSPRMAILAVARAGKRLVAAGERGIINYSDNGGSAWKQAQTPTSASLVAMRFVGDQLGWAVGHMGIVLHTADGGLTWHKQLDGAEAARLALAEAQKQGDARAIADAERLVADGADKPFFDLQFLDERTGYIVGAYNLIFRTDDGGNTWKPWQVHVGNSNPKGLHLYGIRAVGSALFIAGEQGLLLRSDDQGLSFVALASPYKGSWFGLVAGRDGEVLAYGLRGNVFVSTDQGRNWQPSSSGTPVSISAGTELTDGRIVLVSQAGEVLVSADQGQSFTHLPEKTGLPLAAVAQGPDGLVLGSLRGVLTVALPRP
jgi:photosystem II stability/assembly factor-like uncharacterized protein